MPVQRIKLSDQVADQLRAMITAKQYRPGEKLPVESELAEEFGVSRITVREAMQKLDVMGIVEVRQGAGTFVREITPAAYIKTLLPMLSMDNNSLKDIFEIRQIIECKSAELAALNATAEDLAQVKLPLSKMPEAARNGKLRQYNGQVHPQSDSDYHPGTAQRPGGGLHQHGHHALKRPGALGDLPPQDLRGHCQARQRQRGGPDERPH